MDRNTAPRLSPKSPACVIFSRNPDRETIAHMGETLADMIAQHGRLYVLGSMEEIVVTPPRSNPGSMTIATYVDGDASGEPAAKVFPYRLGNEAVRVSWTEDGSKVAFADLPLALRLIFRPRKERETHVVTVRAHGASRNYKVTASASGLHFYRDFDDRPGKWHLEGGAPGVLEADWRAALQRHVCHG